MLTSSEKTELLRMLEHICMVLQRQYAHGMFKHLRKMLTYLQRQHALELGRGHKTELADCASITQNGGVAAGGLSRAVDPSSSSPWFCSFPTCTVACINILAALTLASPTTTTFPSSLSCFLPSEACAAVRFAELVVDDVFTAPCNTSVLYPTAGGNMHRFTAIAPCAILDILGPPYSIEEDRDCTYYTDVPYSSQHPRKLKVVANLDLRSLS
ncbi:plant cysteine oxidase 3 [Triticum aestivum]|uniref:plant cysteine oxidase 3 n=1 Tax=Triticum aestivum TaxID=4565 RepID=UPI001D018C6F|nr:plant cysteine oxidase 3-like [Triticum aestivum]